MNVRGAGTCLTVLMVSALMVVGCTEDSDDESGNPVAGVYQGLIIRPNGNFAAVTGYISSDGIANLVVRRRMESAAGVASGRYGNGRYSGTLSRPDKPAVPVLFHDQSASSDLIVGRLRVPDLEGQIRLQREQRGAVKSTLAGHYAFVDQAGRRWKVRIAAQGGVTATAKQGECSFQGQFLDAAGDGVSKLAVLELSAGSCSPFDGQPKATIYLLPDTVGSVDSVHVAFAEFNKPYDWYWFPVD